MVKPPEITRSRVQEDPHLIWNTFVDFISKADTREMNDIQMAAQLTFWYDSEICQGGHLHYFENSFTRLEDKLNILILATLDALKILKADQQAEILGEASDLYFCKPRQHSHNPHDLKYLTAKSEFTRFDNEYRQASPGISELLDKYLMAHLDNFVKIV